MNTVGKTNVRMCVCVHSTVTSPGVGAPSMVWFQAYIHHSYTTHTQTSTNGASKYVNEAQLMSEFSLRMFNESSYFLCHNDHNVCTYIMTKNP